MNELIRAALVIARRDYVATVWSKTFLLFLIGPLFPILFGVILGGVGSNINREAIHPAVAVIAEAGDGRALLAARARLAARLGETALPDLKIVAPAADQAAQARALLASADGGVAAVLRHPLDDRPLLAAPRRSIAENGKRIALIVDQARLSRAAGTMPPRPVAIAEQRVDKAAGADNSARLVTARAAQLVLVMLTMILAGMLLSNLIEEKSNKVIEVLAAAVPVDAIFLGKLGAMLAMSLTGIAVWGTTAVLAVSLLAPSASASIAAPAVPRHRRAGVDGARGADAVDADHDGPARRIRLRLDGGRRS